MKHIRPLKAIRKFCIGCCGGSLKGVKFCPAENCLLYPFRSGKNPNRQGIGVVGNTKQITCSTESSNLTQKKATGLSPV